jgi:hypothetical protein
MSLASPTNPPHLTIDTLLELLSRQKSIVARLGAMGENQSSLIQHGRGDALLGLLQQRQELIDQFAAAQRQFHQCQEHLSDSLDRADDPTRSRIRSLVAEISSGIEAVMARDATDQQSLQERRSRVSQELNRVDAAQGARNAYRKSAIVSNRFADTQG